MFSRNDDSEKNINKYVPIASANKHVDITVIS